MQAAVDLLGLAHQHLGAGLTGFEVMGQFALGLVDKHYPQLRVPLWRDARTACCWKTPTTRAKRTRAPCSSTCWKPPWRPAAPAMPWWPRAWRRPRPVAHPREHSAGPGRGGLNIKHDISIPIARIPAFVEETDALLAREIAGVRLVNFGHLGDGNLHYNVQAPEGGDAKAFLRDEEDRINTLVFDSVARHAARSAPSTAWAA
jgi:hypothetical protein